jgi:hypothetical protein
MHWTWVKHTNVDAFNCNPVDVVDEWEDLIEKIQNCKRVGPSSTLTEIIWIGQKSSKLRVVLQQLGREPRIVK